MPNTPDTASQLALAIAKTNDPNAIGALIEAHRTFISGLASSLISPRLQAKTGDSDLVQDTCTAAYEGFKQFKGETEAEFRAWLKAIITKLAAAKAHYYLDTAKRDAKLEVTIQGGNPDQSPIDIPAKGLSPSSIVSRLEERELLLQKLGTLSDVTREVITLCYRDDLSFEEIAQRVGKSMEAVKKIWLRGIESLKPRIDK